MGVEAGQVLAFKRLSRLVMYNAPAFLGYTIAAIILGAATALTWPVAVWWFGAVDTSNLLLQGFLYGALGLFTYILWGLALLGVIALVRNVTRLSVPKGRYKMRSWHMTKFFIYNLFVMIARYLFLPVTRMTRINILFYRLMGADIGKGVVINTAHVYDLNLITMGHGSMVGGSAVIMCHMGQGDDAYIEEVVVEDGASIGEGAIVFPGAHIGENAIVGAGSVVPKDFEIPPNSKWSGVPVRRVDQRDDIGT